MNTKNFEFLRDGLKFMGFGETMHAELESKIKEQPKEFQLNFSGEFKKDDAVADKVDYRLNFRKSDQTDMYFFNSYQATLKNDDSSKEKTQTFYINKNSGVTAKEAYNLLSGRAVNKDLSKKDGQPYNAWLQLDFTEKDKNNNFAMKQFTDRYGYDLREVLGRYPIKEAFDEYQKSVIMRSLEKGNQRAVTLTRDGKDEKMFIEANPQFKTLNLYDGKMQRVFQENGKKEGKQETEKAKDNKETAKQEVDEDGEGMKKKQRKKGIGV